MKLLNHKDKIINNIEEFVDKYKNASDKNMRSREVHYSFEHRYGGRSIIRDEYKYNREQEGIDYQAYWPRTLGITGANPGCKSRWAFIKDKTDGFIDFATFVYIFLMTLKVIL